MIYTPTGKYLKQKTMKFYEARLNPSDFIRIHRSYIINVSFIKNIELYEKDTYRVTLKTNSVLPFQKAVSKELNVYWK
jgi:two-component system LytT family response regulator